MQELRSGMKKKKAFFLLDELRMEKSKLKEPDDTG